jgi:serine/threonine-protein kinase
VSTELFNTCVQSRLYSICRKKFEYEASGDWSESDLNAVVSPRKAALLREFESFQRRYPLPRDSFWDWVPRHAVHYFRFCKDYHCDEIMQSIREVVSEAPDSGVGSLQRDLMDAPILWVARNVRTVLGEDGFGLSPQDLELVEFERKVNVNWDGTSPDDSYRTSVGADLFGESPYAESIAHILEEFESRWDVSLGKRVDGRYSIHFRSRYEFLRFREEALAIALPDSVLEADVFDLLRPEIEDEDLVALIWEPLFTIRSTLAKVVGLHETSETPIQPVPEVAVVAENPQGLAPA